MKVPIVPLAGCNSLETKAAEDLFRLKIKPALINRCTLEFSASLYKIGLANFENWEITRFSVKLDRGSPIVGNSFSPWLSPVVDVQKFLNGFYGGPRDSRLPPRCVYSVKLDGMVRRL